MFTIDSLALRASNGRSRNSMKCEVKQFERATDLTIIDWINLMEDYFTISQVPPNAFIGFMLMKIVPKHINKVKQCQSLRYFEVCEKLVEVFENLIWRRLTSMPYRFSCRHAKNPYRTKCFVVVLWSLKRIPTSRTLTESVSSSRVFWSAYTISSLPRPVLWRQFKLQIVPR